MSATNPWRDSLVSRVRELDANPDEWPGIDYDDPASVLEALEWLCEERGRAAQRAEDRRKRLKAVGGAQ